MNVKPYPIDEGGVAMAAEPSVQETITKRHVSMAEVMRHSITLEELDKHLDTLINKHYHPVWVRDAVHGMLYY